jgi:putative (di)nucleoside polyphosphate hydrolase
MIDEYGFRPNVGIVLCNPDGLVFWGRRTGQDGWQFPQGGMKPSETPQDALYRELKEEVGLDSRHVEILARTQDWLHYEIPAHYRRAAGGPFRGQKQIWFLLKLVGQESDVCLTDCDRPEFDAWRWIEYWRTLDEIIQFKRDVYRQALAELAPHLPVSLPLK